MKILHVIPGITHERGGPSTVLAALCRNQAKGGHVLTVLTTDQGIRNGEKPVLLDSSVQVEQSKVMGPDRLAYAPGLPKIARRLIPYQDIIHIHSVFTYPVHICLREALNQHIPVVVRPCGHLHRYSLRQSPWRKKVYLRCWGRMVRRACTSWHFTSLDEATHSWPGDDSPQFVLPNGIEPADFQIDRKEARKSIKQLWPQLGDGSYILFLGRLHPKKRLDFLLEAFLAGAQPKVKLVVAGPDECNLWPALVDRFLRKTSNAERVLRVGTVEGRVKVNLLAEASLFVLPSEHENFGIAALEALAAGTPVLLSPHVDLAGMAGVEGLVRIASLDHELWRQQFKDLVTGKDEDQTLAQACRRITDRFTWGQLAEELEERYRWVLAGCPAGKPRNGLPLAKTGRISL